MTATPRWEAQPEAKVPNRLADEFEAEGHLISYESVKHHSRQPQGSPSSQGASVFLMCPTFLQIFCYQDVTQFSPNDATDMVIGVLSRHTQA
jgi:hypothetical protein